MQKWMCASLVAIVIMVCHDLKAANADTTRIYKDLQQITGTAESRNYRNPDMLNEVSAYIYQELSATCDTVYYQNYEVNGVTYRNVVGVMGPADASVLVVGAHYDVAGDQEGADDNASGTAGLLELARLLKGNEMKYRVELVAYTLEEPPFFRTNKMGSYIHAKDLHDRKAEVVGMVCLEMIGFFSAEEDSQDYPVKAMKKVYGDKGDYITLVGNMSRGPFTKELTKLLKEDELITTKSISAPSKIQGIDFSDHLNYWEYGYDAVMITDTAFYRNKNYHHDTDTLETLNVSKMALVIDELACALIVMIGN